MTLDYSDLIIQSLKAHYGITAVSVKHLDLGADAHASVYKVIDANQTSYFVKLKHGSMQDIGIVILNFLKESKIKAIIPPIKTTSGELTAQLNNETLIVYPFIDGQDGFTHKLTRNQWITLGKTLKEVHELKVPVEIQKSLRKETYSSKWRKLLSSLYPHIENPADLDPLALNMQKFMQKHLASIKRLVTTAETLGEELKKQSHPFVLCHSDIHAGNVFIDHNEKIYVVDWDDPILAPKERDLMFIGGGVANVWNKPSEEVDFYEGYGKTNLNMDLLSYYRHERIVEDMAIYGQELLLKKEGKDREEMYDHFVAMFEANGVVEIAFKTASS